MADNDFDFALERLNILYELSGAQLDEMYVERPDRPMLKAVGLLTGKSRWHKILLTGQHGCGKTTELNKLAEMVSGDYFAVRCNQSHLRHMSEPSDIEFLFVLIRTFLDIARQLDKEVLNRVVSKFRKVMKPAKIQDLNEKLAVVGIMLSPTKGRQKTDAHEITIHREFRRFRSELLSVVHTVIEEIESYKELPVVLIIDDLEKLDYKQVRGLLQNHSHLLSNLPCAAICTVSPWLMFDGELLPRLRDEFYIINISNVPLWNKERNKSNKSNMNFIKDVVYKRAGTKNMYASPRCNNAIVLASGGHLRQYLRLLHTAMLFVRQEKSRVIDLKRVLRVVKDEEMDFRRLLSPDDRKILEQVGKSQEYHYEMPLYLLSNLSVLEYWHPDYSTWYDLNPLTRYSIDPKKSFSELVKNLKNEVINNA